MPPPAAVAAPPSPARRAPALPFAAVIGFRSISATRNAASCRSRICSDVGCSGALARRLRWDGARVGPQLLLFGGLLLALLVRRGRLLLASSAPAPPAVSPVVQCGRPAMARAAATAARACSALLEAPFFKNPLQRRAQTTRYPPALRVPPVPPFPARRPRRVPPPPPAARAPDLSRTAGEPPVSAAQPRRPRAQHTIGQRGEPFAEWREFRARLALDVGQFARAAHAATRRLRQDLRQRSFAVTQAGRKPLTQQPAGRAGVQDDSVARQAAAIVGRRIAPQHRP